MKKLWVFLAVFSLFHAGHAYSEEMIRGHHQAEQGGGDRNDNAGAVAPDRGQRSDNGGDRSAVSGGGQQAASAQPAVSQPVKRARNRAARQGGNWNYYRNQGGATPSNRPQRAGNNTFNGRGPTNNVNSNRAAGSARPVPSAQPAVPARLRSMGVSHLPPAVAIHGQPMRTGRQFSTAPVPSVGPGGKPLSATVIAPRGMNSVVVRTHMGGIVGNATFTARIGALNAAETRTNHYYWHNWNGTNYCHYYDPYGYHWYGWYVGGNCFWTRYWANNWWWYDPVAYRWCYWNDGFWWWPDPARTNVVYVYNDGNYVSANVGQVPQENGVKSKDGDRTVKIVGGDAFLYDTSANSSFKPVYLASNVRRVNFSYDENGAISQVLLTYNDGTFQLFDANGNPFQADNGEEGNAPHDPPPAAEGPH